MKGKIWTVILVLALTVMVLPNVNAASMLIKTGETQAFGVGGPQKMNGTWYLDQNIVSAEESFEYNHTFTYSPNVADIGYHNITFVGQNQNGSVSKEWTDIFVGTLFLVNGTINNNAVNATTESILAEPMGSFSLATFVENAIMNIVPKNSDNSKTEYMASHAFLNLSDTRSGTGETIWLSNGSIYMFPFNTTNKNGTFEIAFNKPYAEKITGERVNVSVVSGIVKISPRSDVNGNFQKGDIQDLTTIRRNLNKPASFCPRCDVKLPYDGLITTADYNQAVAEKGLVETI